MPAKDEYCFVVRCDQCGVQTTPRNNMWIVWDDWNQRTGKKSPSEDAVKKQILEALLLVKRFGHGDGNETDEGNSVSCYVDAAIAAGSAE